MSKKLEKKLSSRHITMLALGGAIGAGLFKGSGEAVGIAGPAVLISYFIGGLLLFGIMYGLGKLVMVNKTGEGLSGIIEPYLGSRTSNFIDWVYWTIWMTNIIAEAAAAAIFLQLWFPNTPAWFFILIIAIITTIINLMSVKIFAETEYWLSIAKISVVILLIIFAVFLVGHEMLTNGFTPVMSRLSNDGGFAPFGMKGILASMLVVIYSYGGSELIAVTVSETENPEKEIPKAIRGVMGRIILFYILPLFFLLLIFPWKELAISDVSPFVMVFSKVNIPFAADIVNFVIVLALFSSINSGVYASSRTLYFRLKDSTGIGKKLAKLNKNNVPQRSVLFSTGMLYAGVVISYLVGENLFGYLMSSISYSLLVVWIMIGLAAIKLFKQQGKSLLLIVTVLTCLALAAIFIAVVFNNSVPITLFTGLIYLVIVVQGFVSKSSK